MKTFHHKVVRLFGVMAVMIAVAGSANVWFPAGELRA